MGKTLGTFALSLCLCHSFVANANEYSLVLGPELIPGDSGKPQRLVKHFSVEDVDREFLVSVQSGSCNDTRCAGAVKINGQPIISSDDIGKQFSILTKPVRLQKQNDISVDVTGKYETPIIVTVISQEIPAATATVPPIGGKVSLEEYASIQFPAGAFDRAQDVVMSVTASPSARSTNARNAAELRLPYEVRINTGKKAPTRDVFVSLIYPGSFFSSNYQMQILALVHDNPDEPGVHDKFMMINSGVDHTVVKAPLPKHAFSNHYGKDGTYEAVITVGLLP